MKFGIFGGVRTAGPGAEGYQSGYQAYVDMVVEAERLGYHASFLVEHHFTGSGQVSASLNLLTFLAARTSRIRLGTAVLVCPGTIRCWSPSRRRRSTCCRTGGSTSASARAIASPNSPAFASESTRRGPASRRR